MPRIKSFTVGAASVDIDLNQELTRHGLDESCVVSITAEQHWFRVFYFEPEVVEEPLPDQPPKKDRWWAIPLIFVIGLTAFAALLDIHIRTVQEQANQAEAYSNSLQTYQVSLQNAEKVLRECQEEITRPAEGSPR